MTSQHGRRATSQCQRRWGAARLQEMMDMQQRSVHSTAATVFGGGCTMAKHSTTATASAGHDSATAEPAGGHKHMLQLTQVILHSRARLLALPARHTTPAAGTVAASPQDAPTCIHCQWCQCAAVHQQYRHTRRHRRALQRQHLCRVQGLHLWRFWCWWR